MLISTSYRLFNPSRLRAIIGTDKYIVRAMPNTAIAVGKSMTCLCSQPNKGNGKNKNWQKAIFNRLRTLLLSIPEAQMQAATVICASGVAFWMRLIRATTQAAIQLGFDAQEAQEA